MNNVLLLFFAGVISTSAFAQSGFAKVPILKLGVISSGHARSEGETSAPNPAASRISVAHGASVEITIENVGTATENVTVRWFAVGLYETSKNYFRSGDGQKAMSLRPKSSETFAAEFVIESHNTTSAKGSYKSGGKLVGWVVALYDKDGNLLSASASDTYLEDFAANPPRLQRK